MRRSEDAWALLREVDDYIETLFAPEDEALRAALKDSQRAGLPPINVSATQGRLLGLLAQISGAKSVLEIGTLGGYSSIHLARALPDGGSLISLELEERHAEVARNNVERAGVADKIEVRVGDAKGSLDRMVEGGEGPFDLIFIDADKEGYPEYLEYSLKLSRPGTVILADNLIRGGDVLDPHNDQARAIHRFNEMLAREERLTATILPIMRERLDGFAIARVLD